MDVEQVHSEEAELIEYYQAYAKQVVAGEVTACLYIKKACERYLDWFNKYEFRVEAVERVESFINKLSHSTGRFSKQKFILLPWQRWIIANIFGFYYPNTNKRVINYVYLELARKQGKTAFAAAITLYMLIADGEDGSEVEIVANSAKQAKICFDMCSNYCGSIDKKSKYFLRYRDKIKFNKTKSFLQILSSDASGNDGYNSYCFVLDECHEQPDSRLWDVLCSSQGMRQNYLAIITTTAGFNRHGFCYSYRKTCVENLFGRVNDDSQFVAIYTLDENDDWTDESNWIKSNPSLDVTVSRDYLQQQVNKAKNNTSLETGVKTKNFNVWDYISEKWLSDDILLKSTKPFAYAGFEYKPYAWCGVDLAAVSDLTAFAVMIPMDFYYYFKVYYYLPEATLEENSNAELYKVWHKKGYLTVTAGNVTDYDYLLADMMKVSTQVYIQNIAYDAYNATQWAINATNQGLPLEPYSQALWNFNRPTKEFERLLKSGRVILDNNEITRYCFGNCVLKFDHNENCKPVKEQAQMKIDGAIACIEALGSYLTNPNFGVDVTAV